MQAQRQEDVYVGRYIGAREIEVTPETVAHYVRAVGDDNPWYSGPSPFGGPVAPSLILHSEVYRYRGWYLPNIYGNLHAKQEWELFHPIMVGDRVTTRSLIVDRYIKRGREYVVNEVTCFGPDGRILQRGRTHQSFLLETGGQEGKSARSRERRPPPGQEGGEVVEELPTLRRTVTLEMSRAFSGPERNYHTDEEEARRLGFPRIVVQGMLSLCFLSELLTRRFGEGWYVGGRMSVNLVNILWLDEELACRALVREVTPEGGSRRAHLQVWCEKADGTVTVVGRASALMT